MADRLKSFRRRVACLSDGLVLLMAACTLPPPEPLPPPNEPCLEVPAAVRYRVELIEDYDADSESLWDPQVVSPSATYRDGCVKHDGLEPGIAFTFVTGPYSPGQAGHCSYREMQQVEGLQVGAGRYGPAVGGTPGVTFAGWTRLAHLAGYDRKIDYQLQLLAPEGDPFAQRERGALPPALLVRIADHACLRAWVVEVTETP